MNSRRILQQLDNGIEQLQLCHTGMSSSVRPVMAPVTSAIIVNLPSTPPSRVDQIVRLVINTDDGRAYTSTIE